MSFKKTTQYILIIIIILSFFNLSFLSKHHGFDSVELAILAEKGYFFTFVRDHLLQTTINKLWFDLWKFFGYADKALIPLQVLVAIFGILGIIFFYLLLTNELRNNTISLLGSFGLAFSMGYWSYSRHVETHIIPTALLIISLFFISKFSKNRKYTYIFFSALSLSLSILASGVYAIFIPTVIAFLLFKTLGDLSKTIKYISCYLFFLCIFWIIPFGIAGIGRFYNLNEILSGQFWHSFYIWFRKTIAWNPFNLSAFLIGLSRIKMIIIYPNFFGKIIINIFFFVLSIAFFVSLAKLGAKRNIPFFVCLVPFVTFFPVIIGSLPKDTQAYTPLLIFIWLGTGFLLNSLSMIFRRDKLLKFCLGLFVIIIFINNFYFHIIPTTDEKSNPVLIRSLSFKKIADKGDLIITVGTGRSILDSMYLLYFSTDNVFSFWRFFTAFYQPFVKYLDRDFYQALDKIIEKTLAEKKRVFITQDVFIDDEKYPSNIPVSPEEVKSHLLENYSIKKIPLNDKEYVYTLGLK